jgi:hypothetical protein
LDRLRATFPAPPGEWVTVSTATIGTGASGDIRSATPHMNESSIISPTTKIDLLANVELIF